MPEGVPSTVYAVYEGPASWSEARDYCSLCHIGLAKVLSDVDNDALGRAIAPYKASVPLGLCLTGPSLALHWKLTFRS